MGNHLWEVDHAYCCTEGNYFSTQERHQTIWEFKTWAEFLAEMGDSDMDYNLLFRWDWSEEDGETGDPTYNGDDYYRNGKLSLFFMHQRKGYHSTSIVQVCRADEQAVIAFLHPRLNYLMDLWAPLQTNATTEPTHEQ